MSIFKHALLEAQQAYVTVGYLAFVVAELVMAVMILPVFVLDYFQLVIDVAIFYLEDYHYGYLFLLMRQWRQFFFVHHSSHVAHYGDEEMRFLNHCQKLYRSYVL